jgi:sugar/nucleoside kinase (ribokinase family)
MESIVFGNITLDVICKPVEDVPRHDSLPFDEVVVAPGGCGSNVAIGLCALGIPTALVGRIGDDDAAYLVNRYWRKVGLDTRYIRRMKGLPTGTSVGLIDRDCQPRFVHTSGANKTLNPNALQIEKFIRDGARSLHIGGFFVLPGLMQGNLDAKLAQAHGHGILTSLDVVRSIRMADTALLWACMPHLDVFLCNQTEAGRLTGESEPKQAARALRSKGAGTVIVKLGSQGCLLACAGGVEQIEGEATVRVVDTTGAGDAFAAGMLAALLGGKSMKDACIAANKAGARAVENLGAVTGWFN